MTDLLTENARLRAALEQIVALNITSSVPWTHEQAADNYWRMIDSMKGIARAALATPAPDAQSGVYWCAACRNTNAIHCAHPDECGNMRRITRDEIAAQADSWKAWLDDLPLPEFKPAIDDLQDYLTIAVNALFTLNIEDEQPKPPAPDVVQEAARVLLADGVAMQTLVDFQLRHSTTASAKARAMRHVQMKAALLAIAGGRT